MPAGPTTWSPGWAATNTSCCWARSNPDTARAIGQRIVDDVGAPLTLADGPDRVSVSVGPGTGAEGADGVEIADRAMLMAKRQGRARLVTA